MAISDETNNKWLAKPSGSCCLKGTIHKGEPRGVYKTVAGVETYISRPETGTENGHILLYFPDVWGMFPNGLLVMDAFADAGYLVLGLDYFRGDPVWKHRKNRHDHSDPNFDYEAWKRKHMQFANEHVPGWVEEVKKQYGKPNTKYACVGYCFGAPYVCDELAHGKTVTAGAFGHPAFLKEHHFKNLTSKDDHCLNPMSPSDVSRNKFDGAFSFAEPLFLSCSETDHTFNTESRRKAMGIMQTDNKIYQLQLFSGVEHGFALRGNMDVPYEQYVKEQSLKSIVEWFDFWLSQ